MSDVSIKYDNAEIVQLSSSGTAICKSEGKYCEHDIVVEYSGGSLPSGTITIGENGTYDVTDKSEAVVNVSGGGVPLKYTGQIYGSGTYHLTITHNLGFRNHLFYEIKAHDTIETARGILFASGAVMYGNDSSKYPAIEAYNPSTGAAVTYTVGEDNMAVKGSVSFIATNASLSGLESTYGHGVRSNTNNSFWIVLSNANYRFPADKLYDVTVWAGADSGVRSEI